MTGKRYFLLLLQLVWLTDAAWAQQRSPYSLQAAVDELHRREAAKFPLNAPPSQQHYLGEQDYWDDDTDFPAYTNNNLRNRHRLNKALAKYLERENYDADNGGGLPLWPFGGYEFDDDNSNNILFNEKKRSTYFRERDNEFDNSPPSSIFRERETQASGNPEHAELTEQFLREIEQAQEHEREERYKEALRNLWEKYQQQENEVEGDLFEEKKRMRTPPYYMLMQKKRSYPVLPWLPYAPDRKKRFPVTKRATKRSLNETPTPGKTEDKVAKELSELFGEPAEAKKKRSVSESNAVATTQTPAASLQADKENNTAPAIKEAAATNAHAEHHQHKHVEHGGHNGEHKSGKHRRHHGEHSHEQNSEENDSEEMDEHDEHDENDEHDEHEEEEDDEDEEEENEERKKKRDLSLQKGNKEVVGPAQLLQHEMLKSRRKKSIDWSKYFGLDWTKKSVGGANKKAELDMKKRSTDDEEEANAIDKKNADLNPEKLDSMEKKLQSIEDFILSETIKYTGAHEGISNPDEIRRVKDHVLSRLATAYSLEKMRLALEKLHHSVDKENHLLRNIIEAEPQSEETNSLEARKRLTVKKENAQANEVLHHEKLKDASENALQNLETAHNEENESNEKHEDMLKKKKRSGYLRYPEQRNDFFEEDLTGAGRYESLNDAYLGNKNYIIGSNQCPLIESMAERCRSVDLLSGDINQELLPICGVHQICYLCGFSQGACDYQYLAEADNICGYNNDCHAAARSVLMILRGSPGPQLGPRECVKNPCLQRVMREIGL